MRIILYGLLVGTVALSGMEIVQKAEESMKHWIITVHDTQKPIATAPVTSLNLIAPAKKGIVFIPKHEPIITPITPEQKIEKTQAIVQAVESGNTSELLRNTNNNIMGGLQENLKNVAAIATMSTAQWKRLMALVIVWGSFSVVQLGLQAYNASRSCT